MSTPSDERGPDVVAAAFIALAAACYALLTWRFGLAIRTETSPDIYGAQYPMLAYFWQSLRQGHGMLWNPFQSCGEPTIPATPPGTLYPLNLVFLVVGLDRGYPVLAALHLMVGGLSVYQLCRGYGLPAPAALTGAFAFQFGWPASHLATWLPTSNLGAYVWLPTAMLLLERILVAPTAKRAVGLGVTLTLSLLAGCPQMTLFCYQVLALRVVWQLLTAPASLDARSIAAVAFGFALPACLGAVQLVPSLEHGALSVRSYALSDADIAHEGSPWRGLTAGLGLGVAAPAIVFASVTLVGLVWFLRRRRHIAAFYGLVLAIYVALALQTPLLDLYQALPLGRLFRNPARFLWVAEFAIAILVGFGAGRLAARATVAAEQVPGFPGWRGRAVRALGWVGLLALLIVGPPAWFAIALACAVRAVTPRAERPVGGRYAATIVLALLWTVMFQPYFRFLPDGALLHRRTAAFDVVRRMMTPQDRAFIHAGPSDYSLTHKSGSLFRLPVVDDYEPQAQQRFATLWVKATLSARLEGLTQYYLSYDLAPRGPLLHLLGARFLLVSDALAAMARDWVPEPSQRLGPIEDTWIYVNPYALPRAYLVPRIEIVRDPEELLDRLASPTHRPREVALVEEAPPDQFLGVPSHPLGEPRDTVTIEDAAEIVILRVRSEGPGFVVLTDQYYPGWKADVNGVEAPILRANYAFRAVRVPAGDSVVRFRYRPFSVYLGAVITLVTLLAILAAAAVGAWRQRPALRSPASVATALRATGGRPAE
jgi:hypothetical protein